MDFGELKNDTNFVSKVSTFNTCLDKIQSEIDAALDFSDYEKLSPEEKVKYDLYLSYSINSLFFMYVKLQGQDANEHGIKNELSRIREAMLRDKSIYERKTLRPKLDKAAAGRFVKHGIHYREKNDEETPENDEKNNDKPKNKKIRFDDSD